MNVSHYDKEQSIVTGSKKYPHREFIYKHYKRSIVHFYLRWQYVSSSSSFRRGRPVLVFGFVRRSLDCRATLCSTWRIEPTICPNSSRFLCLRTPVAEKVLELLDVWQAETITIAAESRSYGQSELSGDGRSFSLFLIWKVADCIKKNSDAIDVYFVQHRQIVDLLQKVDKHQVECVRRQSARSEVIQFADLKQLPISQQIV